MYSVVPSALCNLETEYESALQKKKKSLPPIACSPPQPPFHLSSRPLIKMSITWKKDGVVVSTGIRDFGRRLVISLPTVSDSGYYECEASLRSSSVPAVAAGAFLHVLGKPPTAQAASFPPITQTSHQPDS